MTNVFRVKLSLDTYFTKDIDGSSIRGQLQDTGNVNGGTVGRAKDFVLLTFNGR